MSLVETTYEHIILDEKNNAIIEGTRTKVLALVLDRMAYGWSPEELHFQHPHLTMGQIYAALSYYSDPQEGIDKEIERRLEIVNEIQRDMTPPPLITRLRAKGLI